MKCSTRGCSAPAQEGATTAADVVGLAAAVNGAFFSRGVLSDAIIASRPSVPLARLAAAGAFFFPWTPAGALNVAIVAPSPSPAAFFSAAAIGGGAASTGAGAARAGAGAGTGASVGGATGAGFGAGSFTEPAASSSALSSSLQSDHESSSSAMTGARFKASNQSRFWRQISLWERARRDSDLG